MLCCFEEHLEPLAFSVPQMFTAAVAAVSLPIINRTSQRVFWNPGCGAVLRTWKYSGADTAHMGSRQFGLTHDHNMLLKMGEVRHGKLTNRDRK